MIYTIENENLRVQISDRGAELMSIQTKDGTEYLWQGDAKYWGDRALNLFPYVARLTEGRYTLEGESYEMTIHGFANYSVLEAKGQTADRIVFELTENEETLAMYPFHFVYRVIYVLSGNQLHVTFSVKNTEEGREMYFGLGGHPGFAVPVEEELGFEDYYLQFEETGDPVRVGISAACFVDGKDVVYPLAEGGRIPLAHNLFDNDAIVLKEMSKAVTIKSDKGTKAVRVSYPEMDYLGIWHMPFTDAPYVCIEPWKSLPSRQDIVEDLATQPGLVHLPAGETYTNDWTIEIF